jgi:probable phosphoglycerate mutase
MSGETVRQARFELPRAATQMLLVRHGESLGVTPLPLRDGQADPPLDPVGEGEAELVGIRLSDEPIIAIYTSPLQRTAQTAAPLAARLGLEPSIEADLREVFLGDVDGLNLRVLAADGRDDVRRALREQRWDVLPGAEPQAVFSARVRSAVEAIAARHVGEAIAVFTHGGVIGEILAAATGSSLHAFIGADNASVTHLVVTPGRWIVRTFNDTSHLRALVSTAS